MVDDQIAKAYIEGKRIEEFSDRWFFHSEDWGFVEPAYTEEHREKVEVCYREIYSCVKDFVPANVDVWDALFPEWRSYLEEVTVYLIVGYPWPYDAVTTLDPQGRTAVIMDLGCWAAYVGRVNIHEVAHGLLTHELCHVCIRKTTPDLFEGSPSQDGMQWLDSNTFNEGLAHLVSYEDKEIGDVDWDGQQLREAYASCAARMEETLKEQDPQRQAALMETAVSGRYLEKYACICGMIYLAKVWQREGVDGLKKAYQEGWRGFAEKTVGQRE